MIRIECYAYRIIASNNLFVVNLIYGEFAVTGFHAKG